MLCKVDSGTRGASSGNGIDITRWFLLHGYVPSRKVLGNALWALEPPIAEAV